MKRIVLLLITIFVAQAQLLLSAEENAPYFKHLQLSFRKIQRVCLNAEKDQGPVHILAKCADLDAQYEALLKLRTEIDKHEEYLMKVKESNQ